MNNELDHIRNQILQVKGALLEIGPMRPGAVCRQYRDREDKKGQYFQLSYTYRGKSHTKHVRPEEVSQVTEQIERYKQFKSLVAEWVDLSLRECELLQQQQRTSQSE